MSAPAGWYPVDGDDRLRWWDGSQWTDRFQEKKDFRGAAKSVAGRVADTTANVPADAIWSAVGRPITGIGAGRFWMTPQFLFFERGAFRTDSQQVPIYGVLDVDVSQSLTQKARGLFTVRVHLDRGNRTEIVSMEDIPDGREAQRIINAASHAARLQRQRTQNTRLYQTSGPVPGTPIGGTAGDHQTPASAPDPIEQLRKLAELRDAGILTEEEFSAKKADILSRM